MPPHFAHDAKYLRRRAARVLVLTANAKDREVRAILQRLVGDYELLAQLAEHRAEHRAEPKHRPREAATLSPAECSEHAEKCRSLATHMGNIENTRELEEIAAEWKLLADDPP
jgi:hypothetical protein